ncbi:MAG: sensor histidine kinase [Clostridia bacterium]|nr:sensor histidine kinase [Clostridia bacterium]
MDLAQLFHIGINHGYIPQILLAECLFVWHLDRKSRFPARILGGGMLFLILAIFLPNLIATRLSGVFTMTIYLLSIAYMTFCFDAPFSEILFCCVAAQLLQNLSYNLENLLYLPFAYAFSPPGRLALSLCVMGVTYLAGYRLLALRLREREGNPVETGAIFALAIASTLFVYLMQYLFQRYEIDQIWVTRPPMILCCIFGLAFQFGLLALGTEKASKALLERTVEREQRQYEITQESIDAINRKAHDLKHQVHRLERLAIDDQEELREIGEAIAHYEQSFHTGSPILDGILSEKQWACDRNGITMSVMVKGEALSFMRPGQVASLFGNALDNAIEYEQHVPQQEKRCIALRLFENKGLVVMRVENYFPEKLHLTGALPPTTKAERGEHGFGLRSIEYIAKQYHGSLQITQEGELFVLTVMLQKP